MIAAVTGVPTEAGRLHRTKPVIRPCPTVPLGLQAWDLDVIRPLAPFAYRISMGGLFPTNHASGQYERENGTENLVLPHNPGGIAVGRNGNNFLQLLAVSTF
jgi:hypothetical protein